MQQKLAPARELTAVVSGARPLLEYVVERGPTLLAESARAALRGGFDERVQAYWLTGEDDWLARAVLAPFAHGLRQARVVIERPAGACGYCGGGPWVSSRVAATGSDGAQRMLHCALCALSWQVSRIKCPACDEADPVKLPTFSVPEYAGARIEACESCGGYVKSIDLTSDARGIPEVDDVASVSLDLWAMENGFERFEPGLAGL
ncbi:MAG TPA: formate dehydrogenase accessory protein FdhE [Myxococcales bacterium]|nr:formate dehydrogenase accessory protein FdhE [Myxococcales bacterium]